MFVTLSLDAIDAGQENVPPLSHPAGKSAGAGTPIPLHVDELAYTLILVDTELSAFTVQVEILNELNGIVILNDGGIVGMAMHLFTGTYNSAAFVVAEQLVVSVK